MDNANDRHHLATEAPGDHGAKLRLVCGWEIHPALVTSPYNESIDAVRELAEQVARNAVARVERQHPEIEWEGVALEGHPAHVLIEEADDAYMIVVGNRGQGGFASLLLGSVSQQVIPHANCPVVVVPHPDATM